MRTARVQTDMDAIRYSLTFTLCILLLASCAQESSAPAQEAAVFASVEEEGYVLDDAESDAPASDALPGKDRRRADKSKTTATSSDLGGVNLAPNEGAEKRLLEYSISLQYRTDEFFEARQRLLKLAGDYGYIESSSAYASPESPIGMTTTLRIEAEDLYKALADFEKLGALEQENISSTDHTESMALARLKYERELIRIRRRAAATYGTAAANKNRAELERLLAQSEDRQDEAAHEQWKINDRVSYARVEIHLLGPDVPARVEVPPYYNAFIGLATGSLYLVYALIWMLPLFVLVGVGWWGVRRYQKHRAET